MEHIQHQTSCNRHIPSSISFIYQDRIASELMANSGIWPKCISINGCEHTDKWKHMTWWNCRNSNSANDLPHENQLAPNGCIYFQGHQSLLQSNAFRGSPWGSEVRSPLHSRPECNTNLSFTFRVMQKCHHQPFKEVKQSPQRPARALPYSPFDFKSK